MGNAVNPWLILVVVLAFVGQGLFIGKWQHGVGRNAEKVEWQARDNAALSAANEAINRLTAEARNTEKAHAKRLADIGAHNVKENQDAEVRTRRAIDRATSLVLRQQPSCPRSGDGAATEATAATGLGNGQAGCELPAQAVRDLFQLVGDADRDVRQLADAQAVILSDRETE